MHKGIKYFTDNLNLFCLASVLLFCVVTFVFPVLYAGLPDGFDLSTDLHFASAFRDGMLGGNFSTRWANDNFGFGSVGIRFYPPLAFFALALGQILTNDWFLSILINLFAFLSLGSLGMYLLVREWAGPVPAMIAGMVYAVVPQHLMEIYNYFLYAEFAAWGIMPFCFLFVTRICREGKFHDVILFAISYSALILTHLPTTIIVSICLPIYVLALMDWKNYKTIFLQLSASIALTIAATSFYLIRIVKEFDWLAHNDQKWSTGYYDYSVWLFPNIIEPRKLYILELMSWLMDITTVLTLGLLIPALIYLFTSRADKINEPVRKIVLAATVTALFALFMLSKPSLVIWRHAEFLQRLQFPWRWLSILSVFAVIAFAFSVWQLFLRFQRAERFIVYSSLALIVAMMLFDITQIIIPSEPLPRAGFEKIDRELKAKPIFEGWWTKWAKRGAFDNRERVSARNRNVTVVKWESEAREFIVDKGEKVDLRVSTFYYPYWKATVNGKAAEINMDEHGSIIVPIQDEASTVHLYFEEPYVYTILKWLSVFTWFLFSFVIISRVRQTRLFLQRRSNYC